jgi:hypothetical protein
MIGLQSNAPGVSCPAYLLLGRRHRRAGWRHAELRRPSLAITSELRETLKGESQLESGSTVHCLSRCRFYPDADADADRRSASRLGRISSRSIQYVHISRKHLDHLDKIVSTSPCRSVREILLRGRISTGSIPQRQGGQDQSSESQLQSPPTPISDLTLLALRRSVHEEDVLPVVPGE